MATIEYTKVRFNAPPAIDEKTFFAIKNEFRRNPDFIIDKDFKTFTEEFKGTFMGIGITFLIMIIGFGLGEGITTAIGGFSMIFCFGMVLRLFLSGPSYATYAKERKNYFDRMTYAIKISNSYDEYLKNFYNK